MYSFVILLVSMLANWVQSAKKKFKNAILLTHFIGCSSESTKLLNLLQV